MLHNMAQKIVPLNMYLYVIKTIKLMIKLSTKYSITYVLHNCNQG